MSPEEGHGQRPWGRVSKVPQGTGGPGVGAELGVAAGRSRRAVRTRV